MCADGLALLSSNQVDMQCLVNEVANDASRERMKFSDSKTRLMVVNPNSTPGSTDQNNFTALKSAKHCVKSTSGLYAHLTGRIRQP